MTSKNKKNDLSSLRGIFATFLAESPEDYAIDRANKTATATGGLSGLLNAFADKAEATVANTRIVAYHLGEMHGSLTARRDDLRTMQADRAEQKSKDNPVQMMDNPFVPAEVEDSFIITKEDGEANYYGPYMRTLALEILNNEEGLNWDLVGGLPKGVNAYEPFLLDIDLVDKVTPRKARKTSK